MAKKDNRPFWTADCETDPFQHGRIPKPFIWGLWTGAGFHEFATADEFVAFVRDCDVIIYFHNGGKFDIHFLLAHLDLDVPVKVINGRLVVAHIGKCELRDSWNLLPVALAEYKKDDFDYTKLEENVRHKHMAEIRHYLRNDCVFLYELIAEFEKTYGRHLTQASASLATWKRMSGQEPPQSSHDYFTFFSQFYYGGRVQCFQRGRIDGPCEVYDIRSAYPWTMLSEHPYMPRYIKLRNPNDYKATSMVVLDCISHGCLPWRNEKGAIVFPDDNVTRTYHVPGHEIIAGIETGALSRIRVRECYDFASLISFKDYILHFYGLRKEARLAGQKAVDIFCKLLMNSLYGKFGANAENYGNFKCVEFSRFEDYICRCEKPHKPNDDCDGFQFDGMIGPHALLRSDLEPHQERYLNVCTAASITSQVRAKLWRALAQCDAPIYCDTDSVICRGGSFDVGENLGQWQHEGSPHTVWIGGKKLYLCEGMDKLNKRTGLYEPKMATKGSRLTPAQVKRIVEGETVEYKPEAPTFSVVREPGFVNRKIRATY